MRTQLGQAFKQQQLFIKSIGFGIMVAEIVPTPDIKENPNGDKKKFEEDLKKRISNSGLQLVQQVVIDPGQPHRAFVLLGEGLPPSQYEKNQTTEEDMNSLNLVSELSLNEEFVRRVEMLRSNML